MASAVEWTNATVAMGEKSLEFEPNAPLTSQLEEKARKELRETEQLRVSSVQRLRDMVREKGELELGLDDDKIYLAFLRCCKFYTDSAYDKLTTYYKFTGKNPKIFDGLLPSKDGKAIKQNVYNILPNRDKDGRRILLIQAGSNWNLKELSLNDMIRAVVLLVMGAIVENWTQVSGCIVILDLKGLTINHAWQFSPSAAKFLLDYIQECIPCRLKAIHIVNHPYVFNMIFSIFKPFMNEKIRNRIFFHGTDRSELREVVGAKMLPTQYGGEMNFEPIYGPQTYDMFLSFEDFFKLAQGNRYLASSAKSKK